MDQSNKYVVVKTMEATLGLVSPHVKPSRSLSFFLFFNILTPQFFVL